MKRLFIAAALLLFSVLSAHSEEKKAQWDVYAGGVGGYNMTWGGYGGAEVRASVDINNIVEIGLRMESLSSNVHTPALTVRPRINFKAGALYFEADMVNRLSAGSRINDLAVMIGVGWKMKHFDACLGTSVRVMNQLTFGDKVVEPFNVAYRVQFNVMGDAGSWDVFGGLSNISPYKIERQETAYFYLGGRYDINDRLGLLAQVDIQPVAIFHLTTSFYGAYARVGLKYRF